ncbi:hypothetical protein O181_007456 [Austropuccinia psidii MF-1]|uniref:Reverse transcriptase domain-containing protein n=1 Tax=Austropuccinia psidii MF-1 TaxID=1389203 RepID=A0A9Q3GHM0_9BASI|nr:hypothetical protein [Austropuccinia psidii MF-1]
MRILKKCGGELEHSLGHRFIEPCSTQEYNNALEDIVTGTKIGRKWKNLDTKSPTKPFIKKDKPKEPLNPIHPTLISKENAINVELIDLLFKYKNAFETDKEPLGAIIGHELEIILNVEKPYPPLLRRQAYPPSPRATEALEVHIQELMDIGVLRKVGHNEQVEVTTPIIITWHNGTSRLVGDFRALDIYTIPDRYPIPKIHETLTQLSQAKFITAMNSLKGFHQNFLTDNAKKTSKDNSPL